MKPARVFIPAIISGILLWTAFFPLNLGPVAFFALAPFLTLVRAEGVGRSRRYFAAFVGGFVFYGLALNWIRVAHPMMALFAWPGMTIYCALYWPIALFLLRKLDRTGLPFVATFPPVWVGLEYVRAHFPTGFPFLEYIHIYQPIGFGWYALGYAMHAFTPLIQAVDLGGVYLVSLCVAAINGSMHELMMRFAVVRWVLRVPLQWRPATFTREAYTMAAALILPMFLICYGTTRLVHLPFAKGPRVAAIQGNLAQDQKMLRGEQAPEDEPPPLEVEYAPLAQRAAQDDPLRKPDLIVWPETCFPRDWLELQEDGAEIDPKYLRYRRWIKNGLHSYVTREIGTNTLMGLNTHEWRDGRMYKFNSALLMDADGESAGRYDKIHLVPFGEYVPLREWFPWLQMLTPYDHDYSLTPGRAMTRFDLRTQKGIAKFGVLICYEDTDETFARRYNPAGGGENVDFLVNISNDGWFNGTEEHEQHLAVCRIRAIETRRSIVRAVNMGISAVIDPDGRVIALPGGTDVWADAKKMKAIVRADIPIDSRETVYAMVGDWVPLSCWAALVWIWYRGRKTKQLMVAS